MPDPYNKVVFLWERRNYRRLALSRWTHWFQIRGPYRQAIWLESILEFNNLLRRFAGAKNRLNYFRCFFSQGEPYIIKIHYCNFLDFLLDVGCASRKDHDKKIRGLCWQRWCIQGLTVSRICQQGFGNKFPLVKICWNAFWNHFLN